MIIIAGYTRTDAEKRDGAVEAFRGMVERARAYEGCVDFSISADAVDPERVNLFECWRDQTTLDAWRKVEGARRETSRGRRKALSHRQGRKAFLRTRRRGPPARSEDGFGDDRFGSRRYLTG